MTQDKFDGHRILPTGIADTNRRNQRRMCRIPARALIDGREVPCLIFNLSPGGIGLEMDAFIFLKLGGRLLVTCHELGAQFYIVRWGAHPRYGAELDAFEKIPAAVMEFYNSLPPEEPA